MYGPIRMDGQTDEWTNGQIEKVTYRGECQTKKMNILGWLAIRLEPSN